MPIVSGLRTPLVLVGDGQVELYRDVASVEREVEFADAHRYRLYDASGKVLSLEGERERAQGFLFGTLLKVQRVVVQAQAEPRSEPDILREALVDWLQRTKGYLEPGLDLQQLLQLVADRDGIT